MSDVVIWLMVGVLLVLVVVAPLMIMRSRKQRRSGSAIGLPDLGAVSADHLGKGYSAPDSRPGERNPSATADQPDRRAR